MKFLTRPRRAATLAQLMLSRSESRGLGEKSTTTMAAAAAAMAPTVVAARHLPS